MKKIYIRAGMSPLDNFDHFKVLINNSIATNVGNLIYAYSIYRTLMLEDTLFTHNSYRSKIELADKINNEYDCFVIPLADAFRPDFLNALRELTALVKLLKIPCIVIGVGLRAPFEPNLQAGFIFDEDVKAFVSAVLEKSSIIGVRGEITSEYLTRLGFKEGRDHTVIGCPSMYTCGDNIKIRDTSVTTDSIVCINASANVPQNVHDFTFRSLKSFPNHYFIPQELRELNLAYIGARFSHESYEDFPCKSTDSLYKNDRVRFFVNIPTWIDFVRQADLSFGSRLHGNIAATLAGTPSILFVQDARTRELAKYHNLTSLLPCEIKEDTDIFNVIEKLDFQGVTKEHTNNFNHYIDFLDKNGLDHIYKNGSTPTLVPFDKEIEKLELYPPVRPLSGCPSEEIVQRTENYYDFFQKEIDDKKKEIRIKEKDINNNEKENKAKDIKIQDLTTKIKIKQNLINNQSKMLNFKSVKLTLKIREIIAKTGIVRFFKNK